MNHIMKYAERRIQIVGDQWRRCLHSDMLFAVQAILGKINSQDVHSKLCVTSQRLTLWGPLLTTIDAVGGASIYR